MAQKYLLLLISQLISGKIWSHNVTVLAIAKSDEEKSMDQILRWCKLVWLHWHQSNCLFIPAEDLTLYFYKSVLLHDSVRWYYVENMLRVWHITKSPRESWQTQHSEFRWIFRKTYIHCLLFIPAASAWLVRLYV